MSKAQTFRELISTWPVAGDLSPNQTFARDLGVSDLHVNTMKQRNQVATPHWARLLAAAKKRGVKLTYDDLLAMREEGQAVHRFSTLVSRKTPRTLKAHA